MRDENTITVIAIISIIILTLILYLCFSPLGIRFGYHALGGKDAVDTEESVNMEELREKYNTYVAEYEKYRYGDNLTQIKWANSARENANKIAEEYNSLSEDKLELILED